MLDDNLINYILDQVPKDTSIDTIKEAYEINGNDTMKTILYIWDPKILEVKKPEKEQTKIDELRQICKEMQEEIEIIKKEKQNKSI